MRPFNSQDLHAEVEPAMNPNWVSMVNAAWFGAYGHGEGTHLLGYPAEIDWDQIEADLQKCRENFVQVVRAFIFENLDGCVKIGSIWDVSPEALRNLERLKQLLSEATWQRIRDSRIAALT
ncbi:MAG: hypothetical protein ONB46_08745 [candidate division KSB1 bacterium]|nr:hypothetical protein [candidate division KSB1 bacterium]MDZ7365889.1 hypothetical protein [candidate division KSB1 bacterium]MDZ7403876.1 hypothetical protein [candidate division KSB1 bacterium]